MHCYRLTFHVEVMARIIIIIWDVNGLKSRFTWSVICQNSWSKILESIFKKKTSSVMPSQRLLILLSLVEVFPGDVKNILMVILLRLYHWNLGWKQKHKIYKWICINRGGKNNAVGVLGSTKRFSSFRGLWYQVHLMCFRITWGACYAHFNRLYREFKVVSLADF